MVTAMGSGPELEFGLVQRRLEITDRALLDLPLLALSLQNAARDLLRPHAGYGSIRASR